VAIITEYPRNLTSLEKT